MPFVHARLAGINARAEEIRALQQAITRLMEKVLNKRADLTAVLVEVSETAFWSIGGDTVPVAAHLDVFVTRGTNSEAEKAAFIAEAHALIAHFCDGRLSEATYVVIQDIDAEAWGYGGRTQAARRVA
ncbi:tautomerase family protein [Rhizobium sp. CSW-27]|uniref:tautomerase family protein n=1 Tax=Rhizobium sp. CSW-27 TaxID=2839985 RepID=UPI001C01087F|nr:tautomerase family protein [Rhizobium sp. CSW-27]MBT9372397.1 tautomerase family protein [Rhizobium sp. CSW-27]